MKTSATGRALIEACEGLRLRAYQDAVGVCWLSTLGAPFDLVDQRRANTEFVCEGGNALATNQSRPDCSNISVRKLCRRMLLATEINESSAPLVARILGKSNPFKIIGAVIRFAAVFVIDGSAFKKARGEGGSHKSMDGQFLSRSSKLRSDSKIAILREKGTVDSAFSLLPAPKSIKAAYAAQIRHFKYVRAINPLPNLFHNQSPVCGR